MQPRCFISTTSLSQRSSLPFKSRLHPVLQAWEKAGSAGEETTQTDRCRQKVTTNFREAYDCLWKAPKQLNVMKDAIDDGAVSGPDSCAPTTQQSEREIGAMP